MRITFGILSLCAAGLLAGHVVPMMQQLVLPYWLQGKSSGGFVQMGFGPLQLNEPQICIFEAGLAVLALGLIVVGVCVCASRDPKA